ncbi:hypothetical protein LTR11_009221, partial [Exophiala xenobiotica]
NRWRERTCDHTRDSRRTLDSISPSTRAIAQTITEDDGQRESTSHPSANTLPEANSLVGWFEEYKKRLEVCAKDSRNRFL